TGGNYMVYGPELSFIGDNTSIGLALIMTVPLIRYLQLEAKSKTLRMGLIVGMALTAAAILATQSRGALLGIIAMGASLVLKSRKKIWMVLAIAILVPSLYTFMPARWHQRMGTIATYETDGSAQGRINAWWFAFNLAKSRPLTGGGFGTFDPELFKRFAPNPD